MALRFKEYRAELKAKQERDRQAEIEARAERQRRQQYIDGLKKGQKIKFSTCLNAFTGKEIIETAYFIEESENFVWVSDSKENALNGCGCTILKSSIII